MRGGRRSFALVQRNSVDERPPTSPTKSSGESSATAEDEDALQMYERIESLKENASGKDVFGFSTPSKKNQMAAKVAQELLSRKTTPVSSPVKTPRKSNRKETPSVNTPQSFRSRVAKRLARRPSEDEEEESSSSEDSESSEEEEEPKVRTPLQKSFTPTKSRRRVRESAHHEVEQYFEAQNGPDKTSDRTLSRLKNPKLSQEALRTILSKQEHLYSKEINELTSFYRSRFDKWMILLKEEFNIVTFGLGSKISILSEFHGKCISPLFDAIVVNGFFPSLTVKQILNHITSDIMEYSGSLVSVPEHCEYILNHLKEPLYLIIHNIDGPNLRGEKNQSVLAQLASHPLIHLICSIDHINAPLIWDQKKLSKFNFIWYDTTTFLPYTQETLNENSLMVQQTNALALSSLSAVFASLTPNAKSIFILIAEDQLQAEASGSNSNDGGISFPNLYQRCREAFLVNSDITLRAQLTEFKDHKLIRIKKGFDGTDHLTIPLNNSTLKDFIDEQRELLN